MKFFLVGKGRIGGTWADNFHCINEDGTVGGPQYARKMSPSERKQIAIDIERHRAKIVEELADLDKAKQILESTNQVTPYDW